MTKKLDKIYFNKATSVSILMIIFGCIAIFAPILANMPNPWFLVLGIFLLIFGSLGAYAFLTGDWRS
jgi:xanthine/uracil permease